MSDSPDNDQKTEDPTPKKRREAVEQGDVLQSRELGIALVMIVGAAWIAFLGPMMLGALRVMLIDGLSFNAADLRNFDPGNAALRLIGMVVVPLFILFGVTIAAAIGTPAMLGSLGFRSKAFSFKASKLNPANGIKRMFGM